MLKMYRNSIRDINYVRDVGLEVSFDQSVFTAVQNLPINMTFLLQHIKLAGLEYSN